MTIRSTVQAITVEPLTASLRAESHHETDLGRLAVVASGPLGTLFAVVHTTDDYADAYRAAHVAAVAYGVQVLLASSYRPTVVGADIAAIALADPACQPLDGPAPAKLGNPNYKFTAATPESFLLKLLTTNYAGLGTKAQVELNRRAQSRAEQARRTAQVIADEKRDRAANWNATVSLSN